MLEHSRQIVDSKEGGRVLMHLQDQRLRLRAVREGDCKLLWQWANDLQVRTFAFSSTPILWEDHVQWFARKLQDSNCYIFIALDKQDQAIGQIRFDILDNQQAEIDISLDQSKRGLGYGSELINLAVYEILCYTSVQAFHAFIRPNNYPSIKVFEKAQFRKVGEEIMLGQPSMHYVLIRG